MADQLQLRGGTTTEHSTFTGALREVTVDTDKDTLIVHDAATAGGHPLLREDGSNSALSLGTAGTPSIKFTGDTNTGIYSPGADQVAISTGGTGRLFVDANGRVGVVTSSPSTNTSNNANQLVVGDNTNSAERGITIGSTTGGGIRFNDGADAGLIEYNHASNFMRFVVNGSTEGARIDSSGRLLVGSSSTSQNSIAVFQGNNAGSDGAGIVHLAKGSTTPADDDFLGTLSFTDSGHVQAARVSAHRDGGTWTSGSSQPTRLVFSTTADGASALTERMRIDSSGRVGIGTTSPTSTLSLGGDLDFQQSSNLQTTSGFLNIVASAALILDSDATHFRIEGSEKARIDSSGRVGIGTSSPGRRLSVQNSALNTEGIALYRNTGDGTLIIGLGQDADGHGLLGVNNTSGVRKVQLAANGSSYLTGGFVGVGTTSPSGGQLVVRSTLDASNKQLVIQDATNGWARKIGVDSSNNMAFYDGNTERLRIDSSGRVGIGTSSPGTDGYSSYDNLVIANSDHCGITIKSPNNKFCGINFSDTAGSVVGYIAYEHSSDKLYFGNAGSGHSAFDSSGRLGIGTTSPQQPLHIRNAGSSACRLILENNGSTVATSTQVWSQNNDLVFDANNGEAVRIDSSRRLLVGTSSNVSGAQVQIEGTTASNSGFSLRRNAANLNASTLSFMKSRGNGVGQYTIVNNNDILGTLDFRGADGTTDVIAANIKGEVDGTPGSNDMPGRLVFSTTADGASSPTERMRINSKGNVMVGTTNDQLNGIGAPAALTAFNNGVRFGANFGAYTTGSQYAVVFSNPNGQIGGINLSGTTTSYVASSDYRLKENVVPLTGAADRVKQLQVHRFNFIADPDTTVDGFLAHEAQTVVPEAVTGTHNEVDDDGNPVYQGIDQSKLVPLLTAALQEALAKIETLEQRLNDAGIA